MIMGSFLETATFTFHFCQTKLGLTIKGKTAPIGPNSFLEEHTPFWKTGEDSSKEEFAPLGASSSRSMLFVNSVIFISGT